MILSGNQFIYNGHPSYLYGFRFMWLDKDPEMAVEQEKKYEYLFNRANNTFNIKSAKYDSPFAFEVEMLSDRVLQDFEVRRAYQMFFNQPQFRELKILGDNSQHYYLNCIFSNPRRIEYGIDHNSGIVGFQATMTLDSPWARTDERTIILEPETGSNKVYLYNDSDCQDYIYPHMTVSIPINGLQFNRQSVISSDNDIITLGNGTTSNYQFTITSKPNYPPEYITADPFLGTITSSNSALDSAVSRSNKKFLRLVPGHNTFTLTNIDGITLKYREAKILL